MNRLLLELSIILMLSTALTRCSTSRLPEPPFSASIGDSVYFHEIDLRIADYKQYIRMELKNGKLPHDLYPDTSIKTGSYSAFNSDQLQLSAITGLTYVQVISYCKWQTNIMNYHKNDTIETCGSKYYKRLKKADPNRKIKLQFRLPTKSELTQLERVFKITAKNYFFESDSLRDADTRKLKVRFICTYTAAEKMH